MENITLPVWVLATAVGLPIICLIWIVAALFRRIRIAGQAAEELQPAGRHVSQIPGAQQFGQDLLALQIDTVFSGLAALIETERVKLNMLLSQSVFTGGPLRQAPPMNDSPKASETELPVTGGADSLIGRQVAEAMASGQGVEDVAAQLGLSHAEVALAAKLNQCKIAQPHRKLEAVA